MNSFRKMAFMITFVFYLPEEFSTLFPFHIKVQSQQMLDDARKELEEKVHRFTKIDEMLKFRTRSKLES